MNSKQKQRWYDRRCYWRETSFMYRILREIVLPLIPLQEVLSRWRDISMLLREAPRQRVYQYQKIAWGKV